MPVTFEQILASYARVAICGGPRVGKTTLSKQVADRRVIATDDCMGLPWADVPARLIEEASPLNSFVVEGVQAPRALRKGLEVDAVVLLERPKVEQTAGQASMAKGVTKVFDEWREAHPAAPLYVEREDGSFEGPPLPETKNDSNSMIVYRYDRLGTLDSDRFERTPSGALRAPARFTRTGVLVYELPDGSKRREYRPPEEVFRTDSLATLADAPLTHLHPAGGKVTPESFAALSIGHVSSRVGPEEERFVAGHVVIQRFDAVQLTEGGELSEFSAGYTSRLDPTPGTSPEGEEYDVVQRDIKYNHVALLPRGEGRAGPEVSLRLDSLGHQVMPPTNEASHMELTPEEIAALKALAASALKTDNTEPEKDKVDNEEPEKKLDKGDDLTPEEVAALKALLAKTDTVEPEKKLDNSEAKPEDQERIINDSIEVRDKARQVLGRDYSFTGKSLRQVREDVIRHVDSKFALAGKSDDAVAAAYEMALARHAERADSKDELSRVRTPHLDSNNDKPSGTAAYMRQHIG